MATALWEPRETRMDRFFFPGMALLILGAIFLGFARTYYLAGVFHAPLPDWIIHVHGAVMSLWVLLLAVQTSLVASDRVDIHKKLGLFGFGLACLMVILGVMAASDGLRRANGAFSRDPLTFYIVPMTDILLFGALIFFAYRARSRPASHKRLVLIATLALLDAGVARWPFAFIRHHGLWLAELCTSAFLLPLVAYDLWTTRKIHRVTIWAGAALILLQQLRPFIGATAPWHAFAAWAQNVTRMIHGW